MINIEAFDISYVDEVVELSKMWEIEDLTYGFVSNSPSDIKSKISEYSWIALDSGKVIGYIFGNILISDGLAVLPQGEKYMEIDELYVHPNYRNSGIGYRLVDRILSKSKENGIAHATVYSSSKRWEDIVEFYERHGFKMWFVQMFK